jgi:hypothetical protein
MSTFSCFPLETFPLSRIDNCYVLTPRAKLKRNGSMVAAESLFDSRLKGVQRGPVLKMLYRRPRNSDSAWSGAAALDDAVPVA